MTAPTVSVLIPTFNRADWLIESLESILNQTRSPDEIIVINDGSTDDTVERLQAYRDRIRIVTQANAGKSAALNKAIALAKGDLIWVFDDDDIAEPTALEVLESLLEANPEADFAYGRHDRFEIRPDGQTRWKSTGYWRTCPPEEFLFESLLDMFVHQPGMLVRKELYKRAGPFNEDYIRSQDYDMLLRLAQHGRPAGTDRIVFHQRQHDGPRGTADKVIRSEDRDRVWQSYDQTIFRGLYASLPLGKYLPAGCDLTQPGAMRRALIRRGIVMARKMLWDNAKEDFQKAAHIADRALSAEETADLRKIFMLKYGCDEIVLKPRVRKILFDIKHASRAGLQISRVAGRALAWRVRHALQTGHPIRAIRLASLVIGLNISIPQDLREVPSSLVRR